MTVWDTLDLAHSKAMAYEPTYQSPQFHGGGNAANQTDRPGATGPEEPGARVEPWSWSAHSKQIGMSSFECLTEKFHVEVEEVVHSWQNALGAQRDSSLDASLSRVWAGLLCSMRREARGCSRG